MTAKRPFVSALFGAMSVLTAASADNTFHFSAGDMLTGSTDNTVELRCDNDIAVLGFSFAVDYDETVLDLDNVSRVGTDAADADYYEGQLDETNGYIGYGCVFDLDGDFSTQRLPPGTEHVLGIITFTVLATADTTTTLALQDVAIPPNTETPVRNVLTNDQGQSILPTLTNLDVTIREEAPEIADVTPSNGNAGDDVQISGNHFDHAALAVTICGEPAPITASTDTTIDVTAPECPGRDVGISDCRDVVVSTERGSATATEGFCYDPDPVPVIVTIDPSEGLVGTVITVTGLNLDESGLAITMCEAGAQFDNLAEDGTSVDVTVPEACEPGDRELRITTDFGFDTATFTVTPPPPCAPEITGISPSQGEAGTVISVTGAHFDEPGLAITVCGMNATFENLAADGTSVDVIAPSCPVGPQPLVVQNECGRDETTFEYPSEAGELFVRGDADATNVVDLTDGLGILIYLFQGAEPPSCLDAADADDNGRLELTDAVAIFAWLFSGARSPPPPSPSSTIYADTDCGRDPTDDGIDCLQTAETCGG